jgi:peptidyl-dipeptidase Dcp
MKRRENMKRNLIYLLMIPMILMASCAVPQEENPFFSDFNTPFGVPPFDKITNAHFTPAIEEGILLQEQEIQAIVNTPEPPTFENTILALEYSGGMLRKVMPVFNNFNSSLTDSELQAIAQEMAPKLSAHSDNISLNPDLFDRIQTVYGQKDQLGLNDEQMRLLTETHKRFVRSGAALPAEKQERLREINQQLATLTLQFGQNVLGETNSFKMVVDNEEDLTGLPPSAIAGAAERAASEGLEGKWVFTLHNPSVMPFMYNAENRELRKKMQQAYINRGNMGNEFDNNEIIGKIVNLRLERARLMGYDSHADFSLEETMVRNVPTVMNFITQLWNAGLAIAKEEAKTMQGLIDKQGHDFQLEQWDWRFYAEQVRKELYDIDEEEIRQYFELNTVRAGIFMICEKLWGLQFIERTDVPKYHPDVQVFEVLEADGTHIGILYMDFHPRESKRGGAWMSSYRSQRIDPDGSFVHPVITIVCNFSPPTAGQPSLLTYDEMTTYFHEFGHALHGLLSNVTYPSLAGTSVPRDFVELPSQIMENWANEPEVMKTFAKHYITGEPMPQELMDRLVASSQFNQGFATVEFLASAFLDMEYHTITEPFPADQQNEVASIIDKRTIERTGLIPEIHFRHGSTHFSHIFSGGYSAGYYSYIWSGLLDADAYEAFRETGDVFDRATAQSFRRNILERGGTKDAMEMYIDFRGREPELEPLLRQRGLLR